MKNFTANLGRRLRGIYKSKSRPARPAKIQTLRTDIEDAQIEPATPSPASLYTATTAADGDERTELNREQYAIDGSYASPTEPVSVSAETIGPDQVKDETADSSTGAHEDDPLVQIPSALDSGLEGDSAFELDAFTIPDEHDETISQEQPSAAPEDDQQRQGMEDDFLDEQMIRQQTYIFIEPEEAEDYTDGPPRMILAADGIKQCPALLMTFDLSAKLQRALRAQRDFAKAEQRALDQVDVIMNHERGVKSQIASRNTRLALLDEEEDPVKVASESATLNEELEILESMLQDAKNRRQVVHSGLQTKSDMLREIQAEANTYLEDAFVCARLLEQEDDEPDTPVESIDIQQEYQSFRQALQISQGEVPEVAVPLELGKQHLDAAPLSPGQQAVANLRNTYWDAQHRAQAAEFTFARREFDRAMEYQANHDAADRGAQPIDATPEEFDARWLIRIQELTHELIEAEAALAEAKVAVVAAGIDIAGDDAVSGFVDDVADGYRMSLEQEQIASIPEPKVSDWLDHIPEQASPTFNEVAEVDEDWDTQTVGISDSVSLVAEGPDRRRIDKWRRVCGL